MYFLGIDVGTGGTRALVIDEGGCVITSATEEHRPFASPRIGWAEQDPRDWWQACGVAVHKALAQGRLRDDQISCVGLSGQMHGAVLLDEQARVVRPALISYAGSCNSSDPRRSRFQLARYFHDFSGNRSPREDDSLGRWWREITALAPNSSGHLWTTSRDCRGGRRRRLRSRNPGGSRRKSVAVG
jgi:sugar (pentulose or hexulose) kinase